ncbi:hypothetical protein V8E54_002282 [Elaphomyces granulatus]|jgi:hypothetical protein
MVAMLDLGLRHFVIEYTHGLQQELSQLQIWSIVLYFEDDLSESQLQDICKFAYEQMTESYEATVLGKKKKKPPVMTAMMGPGRRRVILASSMRMVAGTGTPKQYNYANPILKKLLDKAIPENATSDLQKHRTGGCGEINCVAVWKKLSNDSLVDSLIVTWGPVSCEGSSEPSASGRIAPCSRFSHSWGCAEFLNANQIIPIAPGMPLPNFRELTHPGF